MDTREAWRTAGKVSRVIANICDELDAVRWGRLAVLMAVAAFWLIVWWLVR